MGFEQVYVVPEQEKPDGLISQPYLIRAEDPKAFELALKLAKERCGYCHNPQIGYRPSPAYTVEDTVNGGYISFTGSLLGMLIMEIAS